MNAVIMSFDLNEKQSVNLREKAMLVKERQKFVSELCIPW